jgi:hypothetical protein
MEKFARKCSVTGKGMNTGWVWNDGEFYYSQKEFVVAKIKEQIQAHETDVVILDWSDDGLLQWGYDEGLCYYTEWEDIDEDECYLEDGSLFVP